MNPRTGFITESLEEKFHTKLIMANELIFTFLEPHIQTQLLTLS
jgi:hypothetical protein